MSQHELFEESAKETIVLNGFSLAFEASFLEADEADALFTLLCEQVDWQQPSIHIAGRTLPIPRLQSWQGAQAYHYRYSGLTFQAEPMHPKIAALCNRIEQATGYKFNSVLCNLYRNERDSVSWHADDEAELGSDPAIASFSLGAQRRFQVRDKNKTNPTTTIELTHNSLLLMPPGFQQHYVHQLPKSAKPCTARINLTFRQIVV